MNNKKEAFNIISKLNFENLPVSEALTTTYEKFKDNNKMVDITWQIANTSTYFGVKEENGVKVLIFKVPASRIYTTGYKTFGADIKDASVQFEAEIIITDFKSDNVFFGINSSNSFLRFNIKNTFKNGLEILSGSSTTVFKKVVFNYKFEANKKYNIVVTKEYNKYYIFIDGIIIGHCESDIVNSVISTLVNPTIVIGAKTHVSSASAEDFTGGEMSNINISYGLNLKYYNSFTKYGDNLISRLNFGNLASLPIENSSYVCGLESVVNSNINWVYNTDNIQYGLNDTEYYNFNNTTFESDNIPNIHTLSFNIKNNGNIMNDVELLNLNDNYKIMYDCEIIYSYIEPKVEIIEGKTTSALDFENDLTDKVSSTTWQTSGTTSITTNSLFGSKSLEFKNDGDKFGSLSNILTGGSVAFTIDFYALVNNFIPNYSTYINLFTADDNNYSNNAQGIFIHKDKKTLVYYRYQPDNLDFHGKIKINYNEINKITMSYDGSCIRVFVNDVMDLVIGTNNGLIKRDYISFFKALSESAAGTAQVVGLLDNVNIHDGIATKVRDYDEYEDNLIIDLQFDGQAKSTNYIDNGKNKCVWNKIGTNLLVNDNKFRTGYSYLNKVTNNAKIYTTDSSFSFVDDFTIEFEFMKSNAPAYCTFANFTLDTTIEDPKLKSFIIYMHSGSYGFLPAVGGRLIFCHGNALTEFKTQLESNPTSTENVLVSKQLIDTNKAYKVSIVRKNEYVYLYINGVLDNFIKFTNLNIETTNNTEITLGGLYSDNASNWFEGYINYFKMYEGVSVIPELTKGKIKLNFDNDLIDEYGNSTWSNTGGSNTTFDANNSVKGYSIYCNGYTSLTASHATSNMITQNLRNNIYEYDFYVDNFDNFNIVVSTHYLYLYTTKDNGNIYFEFYNNDAWISGYTSGVKILTKKWYNIKFVSFNDKIYILINDILTDVIHTPYTSISNPIIQSQYFVGGGFGGGYRFKGNIDNLRLENDTLTDVINYVDKPAVHLPLETNAINTGFTPLTINIVGKPTYTTIDGKKCINVQDDNYLSINQNNNIFNLGENSDFYMEFDFYVYSLSSSFFILCDNPGFDKETRISVSTSGVLGITNRTMDTYIRLGAVEVNKWVNIKIIRKSKYISSAINDMFIDLNQNIEFNYTTDVYIGASPYYGSGSGYISNFKMFVGTSEIPETYNDKTVLDLDFKPTGKSYLFKDNNNKCIIHPVNITQRDYQNSQYCCTFNGTNQFLQLGKNELLNFGNDDFIIDIEFEFNNNNTSSYKYLLASATISNTENGTCGIAIDDNYKFFIYIKSAAGLFRCSSVDKLLINTYYKATIIRTNNNLKVYINDKEIELIIGSNIISDINFNTNNNTYIGKSGWDPSGIGFFNKHIYSIKVLRNTSDISLLEESNIIGISEKFTLTNGEFAETIEFAELSDHDIKVVSEEDKITLSVDEEGIEFAKDDEVNNVKLFDGYIGDVKDIRVYDTPFYDNDEFIGSELIDTQLPEVEIYEDDSDEILALDYGDYIIKGFIEGDENRKYAILNKVDQFELLRGSGDYYYNGIDELYFDDYEIYEVESKQRYPLYKHEMKKGYISGTVNIANCGVERQHIKAYCYRNDNHRFIGAYELDENNRYLIPNLDVNSKYDIIFKDQNRKIEDISSTYRTPKEY